MSKNTHTIESSDKKEFDEQVNKLLELGCELLEGGYEVIKKKKKVVYSQVVVFKNCESDSWVNGQLKYVENKNEDGQRDGLTTWWYENGQKKNEGSYKNNQKEGLWTHWYEDGGLKSIKNYTDGLLEGDFISYYPNGNIMLKGQFTRRLDYKWGHYYDWFQEKWKDRYQTSEYKIQKTGRREYLPSEPNDMKYMKSGYWTFYDLQGEKYKGIPYPSEFYDKMDGNERENQYVLKFDHIGVIYELPCSHEILKSDCRDNNDHIIETGFYTNGSKLYKKSFLLISGKKQKIGDYLLKDGPYIEWYNNGNKKVECFYTIVKDSLKSRMERHKGFYKDVLDRDYYLYYINGEKCIEGKSVKGKPVKWLRYRINGEIERINDYDSDFDYFNGHILQIFDHKGEMIYEGKRKKIQKDKNTYSTIIDTYLCELNKYQWGGFWTCEWNWYNRDSEITIDEEFLEELNEVIENKSTNKLWDTYDVPKSNNYLHKYRSVGLPTLVKKKNS